MTAPDQVLTDLLAAHEGGLSPLGNPICKCGWSGDSHPAHVALVVEQHMQGQTAELREMLNLCSRRESKALKRAEVAEAMVARVRELRDAYAGNGNWDSDHVAESIGAALEGEQR